MHHHENPIHGLPAGGQPHENSIVRSEALPCHLGYPTSADEYSDEDAGFLREAFHAALARKWIVILVASAVIGLGALYARNIQPVYRSEAVIEAHKVFPMNATNGDVFSFFGQWHLYYETQLKLLQSRQTAETFLKRTGRLPATDSLSEGAASLEAERRREAMIDSTTRLVTVEPVESTRLIEVSLTSDDPSAARNDLREYLAAFMEASKEKNNKYYEEMRAWLKKELDAAKKQLELSERELREFAEKHDAVFLTEYPDQVGEFFRKAGDRLAQSREERLNLEAIRRSEQSVLPDSVTTDYVHDLRTKLAGLNAEYRSMGAVYSPNYYKMLLLKGKIRSLERAVTDIESGAIESSLQVAEKKESAANRNYRETKDRVMRLSPLAVQYSVLKKVVEANGELYTQLLQKYEQAELNRGIPEQRITVASQPTLPLRSLSRSKGSVLLLSVLVGLAAGLGAAFAADKFDTTVKTSADVETKLGAPILGTIPRAPAGRFRRLRLFRSEQERPQFFPLTQPTSGLVDALRLAQSSTELLLPDVSRSCVCVSSALPFEGKTFLSVALAAVAASEGKRALVLDCDLRKAGLGEIFQDTSLDGGLADILSGKLSDIDEAIRESDVPGLFYMPAGTPPANPVALLKTPVMAETLRRLRGRFDFIVIDTPPILGMADTLTAARYSDGVVLVTKQGAAPLDVVRKAHRSITAARGVVLGVVINMADRKTERYDYYASRYGYRRYHAA